MTRENYQNLIDQLNNSLNAINNGSGQNAMSLSFSDRVVTIRLDQNDNITLIKDTYGSIITNKINVLTEEMNSLPPDITAE